MGPRRHLGGFAFAGLAASCLTAAIFRDHLLRGYSFPWDFWGKYTAAPAFVAAMVRDGRYSEWVPFAGGGAPLPVDLQTGFYFPLWWLLGASPLRLTTSTFTVLQILHVPVGALGLYCLARARGCERRWSLVPSVTYVFFGGFYGNAEHADMFRGFAYIPWLLWSLTLSRSEIASRRLILLPGIAWLLASGAYPGQTVAAFVMGSAYFVTELATNKHAERKGGLSARLPLFALALAASAIVAAIVLPYISADRHGLLYRPTEPTAEARAAWSFGATDALGLYLTPFAWHNDGTIFDWWIGIPALMGLSGLRRHQLKRHASLAVVGGLSLFLAFAPSWRPLGTFVASIPFVFSSRFPAVDYKGFAAVSLLTLSAIGWRRQLTESPSRLAPAVVAATLLLGLLVVPKSTTVSPTKFVPLVVLLVLATFVLSQATSRVGAQTLLLALMLIVVADGLRSIADTVQASGTQPWRISAAQFLNHDARDLSAEALPDRIATDPPQRPARVPPAVPFSRAPGGTEPDTDAYLDGRYHLSDYGGTVLMARFRALTDSRLTELMLAPWHAWVVPCDAVDCTSGSVPLPTSLGDPSDRIRTTSYGLASIRYEVDLAEPSLIIENEVFFPGWKADRRDIRPVEVSRTLRGWVLPAGRYSFAASYGQPERPLQVALALFALSVWAASSVTLIMRRRRSSLDERETAQKP